MQPFQTQFTLTRDYLAETYDQSLPHGGAANTNLIFPGVLFVAGAGLLVFTDQPAIAGWAFVALCALELLHIKFRRGWWLFRQTWGKNNDLPITLTIDEQGIRTKTSLVETVLIWDEIQQVIDTDLGVILVDSHGGRQYLSKSILPEAWLARILGEADA